MSVKFEPLDQRTTPDGVTRVLREAILSGNLAAGSQLREAHIASDMGISRAPLREALTRLEEEGLVLKIPFRGAFVAEVSAKTVEEIATLRYLLEPYAAGLATDRLRGADRERLTGALDLMRRSSEAGDVATSIDAHLQFHRLFYECSGHELLFSMWKGWESKLRLFLAADRQSYNGTPEYVAAHELLAELALEGDVDVFRQELAHHIHKAPGASLDDVPDAYLGIERSATAL